MSLYLKRSPLTNARKLREQVRTAQLSAVLQNEARARNPVAIMASNSWFGGRPSVLTCAMKPIFEILWLRAGRDPNICRSNEHFLGGATDSIQASSFICRNINLTSDSRSFFSRGP